MQARLSRWFLGAVLALCSCAQAQSSISTFVSLTGGPTPNPAVVGQTVSMTWKASISGGNSTQTECLVKNASWTWSVDSYTFTLTGGTTPTTLDFTKDPDKVSLAPSGDSARTAVVPATGGGTYNLTVRAKYSCNTSACGAIGTIPDATNSVQFQVKPVGSFVLHPNASDFQSGYQGRVLISKQRGDSFYAINNTTASNTPAQSGTGSHQVTITAQMPKDQVGTMVYFRISDPADASPYHSGNSNDNGWAGGSAGTSPGIQSASGSLATINGSQVAAAEITLDIGTDAGNNFDVEASLVPFSSAQPSDIQKTPRFVAWKRGYIEQDDSYSTGSVVYKHFQQQAASGNDVLYVYSVADTPVGTNVLITLTSPVVYNGTSYNSINRQVIKADSSSNQIEVSPIPFKLPQYSGITPFGSPVVHASTASLATGFGADTAGADSGAFVEFVVGIQGSRTMPNYPAEGTSNSSGAFIDLYWFSNSGAKNVFQLVTRAFQVDPKPGTSVTLGETAGNSSALYTSKSNSAFWQSIVQRNVVHEMGHNFALDSGTNGHVDMNVDAPAVSPPGVNCIMSYKNDYTAGYVKFDSLCYKTIRGCPDPR